jgi:hypothetical protein
MMDRAEETAAPPEEPALSSARFSSITATFTQCLRLTLDWYRHQRDCGRVRRLLAQGTDWQMQVEDGAVAATFPID